jgi:hypothetical protein
VSPLLDATGAERALAIAERIFERGWRWTEEHLAAVPESIGAFGGCVLVADALTRAGREPEPSLREALRRALVTAPDRRGLYDGRAGLLVVLDALDPDGSSFARPRAALRAAIAADLLQLDELDPFDRSAYDLISGAAGKLIALRDAPAGVVSHVSARFAALADRFEARLADPDPERARIDLGVAHGVPGILAALNLSLPGERALAQRYVELILSSAHVANGVHRWGATWDRERAPAPRRAWCYQTVGVASVLHDRAVLDGDDALRALALAALEGTLHELDIPHWDDALCHGRSGVALIYSRVHTAGERFAEAARGLANDVLNAHDDAAPFGYRAMNLIQLEPEDRPQFLDAALGIAMFLIEAAAPSERRWLPLLGLLPGGAPR